MEFIGSRPAPAWTEQLANALAAGESAARLARTEGSSPWGSARTAARTSWSLGSGLVAPGVQAGPPQVQHFTVDNEFDPGLTAQLSATCGFPVDATVSGRLSEIVRTTDSGVRREVVIQSVLITFTNPATGESVTLRNAFQPKLNAHGAGVSPAP